MPTATWLTGQTSGSAGGAGYGTAAWQSPTNSYPSPTAGRLVCVWVIGMTANAGPLDAGASFASSVATGTNPTWTQHVAGWLSSTSAGWAPFVTMFYTTMPTCTNLRFTLDAGDSIYQWTVVPVEYENFDAAIPFGRWGSDTDNADTADNEVTTLDQNTGAAMGANSHVVGIMSCDSTATFGVGTGFTERYVGPLASGETTQQIQDDQTSPDDTVEWGAASSQVFSWITFCVEVRDSGGGGGPAQRPLAGVANAGIGTRATAGTTTVSLAYPAGVAAESLAIAGRSVKPSTATATAESGWTQGVNNTGGTGTQGIDTGPSRLRTDTRQLVGNESGSVVFDQASTPNAVTGAILIYSKDSRMRWELDSVSGTDNSHGTGRSHTSGSTVNLKPGDVVVCFLSSDTDDTTAYTSPAITASGITFGTTIERIGPGGAATGQDVGMMVYEATVTAGTGTVSLVMTLTGGPSSCGVAGWTRMRQVPKPFWDKFYV